MKNKAVHITNEAVLYERGYIMGAIEAVLFACGSAVEVKRLAQAVGVSTDEITDCVAELKTRYGGKCGIEIIMLGDKCQMRTNPAFFTPVNALVTIPEKKALTPVLLETLAIIAYRQPVTKAVIEDIRGLSADHAISRLMELDLVRDCGRLDAPGRPILFETTDEFLRRFGISGLDELTAIPEMHEIIDTIPDSEPPETLE